MSAPRQVELSEAQVAELIDMRDHHPKAYYRERAAAILKIHVGMSLSQVAREGLLRKRNAETVREWVKRYESEGLSGWAIRKGRGRKPCFFPTNRS